MNKKKFYLLVQLAVLLVFEINAQESIQQIGKGDKLPPITQFVRQGKAGYYQNFEDLKGKLILLDLWGVRCGSCLASMPEMQRIQEKYKERLRIFYITKDDDHAFQALLDKFSNKKNKPEWFEAAKHLNFINGDSIFTTLFPAKVQPAYVWIDTNSRVLLTAHDSRRTEQNIEKYFDGNPLTLIESKFAKVDLDSPFSWFGNNPQSPSVYYSLFTGHFENGGDEMLYKVVTDSINGKQSGIVCFNMSIMDLYKIAFKRFLEQASSIPDKWDKRI